MGESRAHRLGLAVDLLHVERDRAQIGSVVDEVLEEVNLAAELPDEAMDDIALTYRYDITDNVVHEATGVAERRRDLATAEHQLANETHDSVQQLIASGYSVRDIAILVGLTPGRVSQLSRRTAA